MLAILCELELDDLIEEDAGPPKPLVPGFPNNDEKEAIKTWEKRDKKARTRIELAVTDSEIVHLLGMDTAREKWQQLCTVYESQGRLRILAAR